MTENTITAYLPDGRHVELPAGDIDAWATTVTVLEQPLVGADAVKSYAGFNDGTLTAVILMDLDAIVDYDRETVLDQLNDAVCGTLLSGTEFTVVGIKAGNLLMIEVTGEPVFDDADDDEDDNQCSNDDCDGTTDDGDGFDGLCGNCADATTCSECGEGKSREAELCPSCTPAVGLNASPAAPASAPCPADPAASRDAEGFCTVHGWDCGDYAMSLRSND